MSLPVIDPGARLAIAVVTSEGRRSGLVWDPRAESVVRFEDVPSADMALHVLTYPFDAKQLHLPTGVVAVTEASYPFPLPMEAFERLGDSDWRPSDGLPKLLDGFGIEEDPPAPIAGSVRRVAVGHEFSCALLASGRVACWGSNQDGHLARESPPEYSELPLEIDGVADVRQLEVGVGTTCALRGRRDVMCWGGGASGTLGRGSDSLGTTARPVDGLSGAVKIAMASAHACVATSAGYVACWGSNELKATGQPEDHDVLEPRRVEGVDSVADVITGESYSCALKTDGSVWCWGRSELTTGVEPTEVSKLGRVESIAGSGATICGRRSDGSIWCLGSNRANEIAPGGPPLAEDPLESVLSREPGPLEGRGSMFCVDGEALRCTGSSANVRLERDPMSRPELAETFDSLSAGRSSHACAVRRDGSVGCWGVASSGQLGIAPVEHREPVAVPSLRDVRDLHAEDALTCAFRSDGSMSCFGANYAQVISRELAISHSIPTLHWLRSKSVATTTGHACVIDSNAEGAVWCWGTNSAGQLGRPAGNDLEPVAVAGTEGARAVSAAQSTTCAVDGQERLWCWGSNRYGQLGTDTDLALTQWEPKQVRLVTVRAVGLGQGHACAIAGELQEVYCWGDNNDGELGIGVLGRRPTPGATGLTGAAELGLGADHTCVRRADGRVFCFGGNKYGQLGIGTRDDSSIPVEVPEIDDAVDLGVGADHTCVARASGQVTCFGLNQAPQVRSTRASSIAPAESHASGATPWVSSGLGPRSWSRTHRPSSDSDPSNSCEATHKRPRRVPPGP
ncbi:MAG: hypothetical protein HY791_27865 [Deltaproteobacteria bacterium]|nr:hypothetical protein [Deltaproteobacteria bacterium]